MRLFSDLRRAVRCYQVDWVSLLRRIAYLRSHGGFTAREALQEGLLDTRVPESALAGTISKRTLVQLQRLVNPVQFDCLTEDKGIFYTYCGAKGLPIPRLFGVAARPTGFSAEGCPLRDKADWQAFVAGLPAEFVVKPSQGVYGWGVEIFRRDAGGFVGSASGRHSEESMGAAFFTDPRYSTFVIQERLVAHPAMQHLSGTPYLQTVRMVTDVDDQGVSRVVCAMLRIIAGAAVVDNYAQGTNGNLSCLVDLADGILDLPLGVGPDGFGVVPVPHHPKTGVPFRGFRLPDWKAACALANRAALLFLPMRSLGWDIALTAGGPRIVEANNRWDPVNFLVAQAENPARTADLVALLNRLRNQPRH
jgi:hypothetical protein